jgi:hypothetical protein
MTQAFAPDRVGHDGRIGQLVVPLPAPETAVRSAPRTEPVAEEPRARSRHAAARPADVRLGRVRVWSTSGYLLGWSVVVMAVWVAICCAAYWVLLHTGALASVSESAATILDVPLGSNGLISFFTWSNVLGVSVLTGGAVAVLWFFSAVGALLVHNALTAMTRGPRVLLKR